MPSFCCWIVLQEEKRCLKKELDKISQERTSSTEEEITSKWKEITKSMDSTFLCYKNMLVS